MTPESGLDQHLESSLGNEIYALAAELYPICRSITGNGIRSTLNILRGRIPLEVTEVPTGTPVFDWTVPREWNIRDAYIKDSSGNKVVDFHRNNLHVMSYSVPVHATMSFDDLKPHLFTLPEKPDWIPYRTSYYRDTWGFCLTHKQFVALQHDKDYVVCIDSSLEDGHLTYGQCYLPGHSTDEFLISCHICHPSLANDNLSGVTVAARLAELLGGTDHRYSYRFLFTPGTIGAITWLAQHQDSAERIQHGLVLTSIGDKNPFHYKKSRRGDAIIDRVAAHVLRHQTELAEILEFSPYGYDERQYCSPGFNLPVGCLMRGVWGSFPEYHTSADNLDFISASRLAESLRVCSAIVDAVENNYRYQNLNPYCELQLGRRNLYRSTGGTAIETEALAYLWILNLSDGQNSILDIAERARLPFPVINAAARTLHEHGLLTRLPDL